MENAFSKRNYLSDEIVDAMGNISTAAKQDDLPVLLAMVMGLDSSPRRMSRDEIESLGDPFSAQVILKGKYPLTLQALIAEIDGLTQASGKLERSLFLVSEGAQLKELEPRFENNARLVFVWRNSRVPAFQILLSTVPIANSQTSLLQLIAWSAKDNAFHFYQRKNAAWVWVGHSFFALKEPTRGLGPFDGHVNGGLVMKELKFPWAHWHSQSNSIPRESFASNSEFNTNPLFATVAGAEGLERIVRSGIRRWTRSRLASSLSAPVAGDLRRYFNHLVVPTSVNLVSSSLEYKRLEGRRLTLPSEFFIDVDALEWVSERMAEEAGIVPAARLELSGDHYKAAALELGIFVPSERSAVMLNTDTYFCFIVPERAFEDTEFIKQLIENNMISARLALCLLLVDFHNPLVSPRRAALGKYCPSESSLTEGMKALDDLFVEKINQSAMEKDSPEEEFLNYWKDPDVLQKARQELSTFFEGLEKKPDKPGRRQAFFVARRLSKRVFPHSQTQ
ncbi:hypothetical protein [Pseudomonas fluorescens]|uniref:hypothetical protein n=1 Tax=Pseudomonas fluorescens TaxID=294 RepID=UPI001A9D3865|nr:hypothetical protein [Pseudomonas fluorescens]QTD31469.1 hypothetical protein JZM58_19465 [Pseudomonas fluorescens]